MLTVGAIILILEKIHFGNTASLERELHITIPEDLDYNGVFDDLFQLYTQYARLEYVKTTNMGTLYELFYCVKLKKQEAEKTFIDDLRCRNGNLPIILGLSSHRKNEL